MSLIENTGLRSSLRWANYAFLPSPVIGFHVCDESAREATLCGEKPKVFATS